MILGIDTSNYTTSTALCESGIIIYDNRQMLPVKNGELGLRQSEAVFSHLNNINSMFDERVKYVSAVCVSTRPRALEGSYMPCFKVGSAFAKALSASLNIPLYEFSHQQGHIRSALYGNEDLLGKNFLGVHLSGGTAEVLHIREENSAIKTDILASSIDISAGQLIDRTGVMFGKSFPCGKELDGICPDSTSIRFKIFSENARFGFSGVEAQMKKAFFENVSLPDITRGIFDAVCETISRSVIYAQKIAPSETVLFFGGVSAGEHIRSALTDRLCDRINVRFGNSAYCSDNACGIALLGEGRSSFGQ